MSTHMDPAVGVEKEGDKRTVVVQLNGAAKEIRAGHYKGSHLKRLLGVPLEHELDLVVNGEFRPVTNDDHIEVRGGEVFVSHCGQGASS